VLHEAAFFLSFLLSLADLGFSAVNRLRPPLPTGDGRSGPVARGSLSAILTSALDTCAVAPGASDVGEYVEAGKMRARTQYPHVVLDDEHGPLLEGTTLKVIELVTEQRAYGWSPEELRFQHPDLTLGQVHAALAYYWDHAEKLDREVTARLRVVELQRAARGERLPPSLSRLRARGI